MTDAGAGRGDDRSLVMTVLAGGGFTFETKCLLQSLESELRFVYLAHEYGGVPGTDGIPLGDLHAVPMFATVTRNSKRQSAKAFVATFRKAIEVMRATPVTGVVGIGCSHVVPMFLAARLLGRRTIYIESITRADRLSTTGRIVYAARLADTFLVQWPELAARLPRAAVGTIL